MLTFNALLRDAGISLETTRLLRHQDNRMRPGWSTYRLWRRDPVEFARYESIQGVVKFIVGGHIASFVVDPMNSVTFVGLSKVLSAAPNQQVETFSFTDEVCAPGTVTKYELARDERFSTFEGRLVIAWGGAARAWCQRADNQEKTIVELRREVADEPWPGIMNVRISQLDVLKLPPSWVAQLRACKGVYLLVCPETGEQYVGSATGDGGFLERWSQYAANGHGGNVLLVERLRRTSAPLDIAVLEVFGSTSSREDSLRIEERWKRVLGSRAHGLNS